MRKLCEFAILIAAVVFASAANAANCEPKGSVVSTVEGYYERNRDRAPGYGQNWKRVLVAFGERDDDTAFSVDEARAQQAAWGGWKPIADELERLEDCGWDPHAATVEAEQIEFAQAQEDVIPEGSFSVGVRFLDGDTSKTINEGDLVQAEVYLEGRAHPLNEWGFDTGAKILNALAVTTALNACFTLDDIGRLHIRGVSEWTALIELHNSLRCVDFTYSGAETHSDGTYWEWTVPAWIGRPDNDDIDGDVSHTLHVSHMSGNLVNAYGPPGSEAAVITAPTTTLNVEEDDISTAYLNWVAGAGHRDASIVLERKMYYDCHSFTGANKILLGTQRLTFTPPEGGAAGNAYALRITLSASNRTQESGTGDNGKTVHIEIYRDLSARQAATQLLKWQPVVRRLPSWTLTVEEASGRRMVDGKCVRDDGLFEFNSLGERVNWTRTIRATGGQDASTGHHEIYWGRKFVYPEEGNEAFRVRLQPQNSGLLMSMPPNTTAYHREALFGLDQVGVAGTTGVTIGEWIKHPARASIYCPPGGRSLLVLARGDMAALPDGFTQDMFRWKIQGGTQDLCKGL